MLELDLLHRTHNPLPPRLRGQLRWVAAHTNGCAYGEAYAAYDLRAAGVDEAGIRALRGNLDGFPAPERAALTFARKLTRDASTVTDEEVANLLHFYGEAQVVAMVLLLSHASFQDRLILALALPLEEGGPLQPCDVHFTKKAPGASHVAAPRKGVAPTPASTASTVLAGSMAPAVDLEWASLNAADLDRELARQQQRQPRIRLPQNRHVEIRWGQVCRTYQPELAAAWAECTRAFGEEADQDPVFEESLFWVITRSVRCFY
jgi:hypothetical protein